MATTRDPGWRSPMLHTANGALLAGLLLFGIQNWDKLPGKVPIHFDFSGAPDRYADKGLAVAFVLFGLPLLLSGIMYGAYWLVHVLARNPLYFTSTTRKILEATPRAKRHLVIRHLKESLALLTLGVLALLWSINTGLVGVALGVLEGLAPWRVLPFVLGLVGLMVWRFIDLRRLSQRLAGEK